MLKDKIERNFLYCCYIIIAGIIFADTVSINRNNVIIFIGIIVLILMLLLYYRWIQARLTLKVRAVIYSFNKLIDLLMTLLFGAFLYHLFMAEGFMRITPYLPLIIFVCAYIFKNNYTSFTEQKSGAINKSKSSEAGDNDIESK
jgi:hypothetical protein